MEFIHGKDLFGRVVEKERYTEFQARWLFWTAVHYIHEDQGTREYFGGGSTIRCEHQADGLWSGKEYDG